MILIDDIVHVLAGPTLAFAWQELFAFEVTHSSDVSGILVNVDYSWVSDVRSAKNFAEKLLSRSNTTDLIQEKIEGLAGRVYSAIEIQPLASDLDIGLVDPPRIIGLFQIWAAARIDFRCILLDPAVDGGVVQRQTPFRHHFL
jgi:hypothetical protein